MAMVKFAFRMLFELERIKSTDGLKFEMRIGIHTGEPCVTVILTVVVTVVVTAVGVTACCNRGSPCFNAYILGPVRCCKHASKQSTSVGTLGSNTITAQLSWHTAAADVTATSPLRHNALSFTVIYYHIGAAIGSVIGQKKPRYLMWGKTPLIANELESQPYSRCAVLRVHIHSYCCQHFTEASSTGAYTAAAASAAAPAALQPFSAARASAESTFRRLSQTTLKEKGYDFKPAKIVSLRSGSSTEALSAVLSGVSQAHEVLRSQAALQRVLDIGLEVIASGLASVGIAITTYMIEMESVTALSALASEIKNEQKHMLHTLCPVLRAACGVVLQAYSGEHYLINCSTASPTVPVVLVVAAVSVSALLQASNVKCVWQLNTVTTPVHLVSLLTLLLQTLNTHYTHKQGGELTLTSTASAPSSPKGNSLMSVRALSKLKNVLSKNKMGSNASNSSSNVLQGSAASSGTAVVSASAPTSPNSNSFHTASSHRKSKDSPVSGNFSKFHRDGSSSSSDDEIAALLITKPNGTLFQMARKVSAGCMHACVRGLSTTTPATAVQLVH
eukprot:20568-Heterococcus_DN1.PRE.2